MASLITKTIVNGHENTRSLSTIEETIGDGCRNNFSFYGRFITSERKECFSSALCEGNNFNSLFMPKGMGLCVKFSEEEVDCNVLEVVTTFQEPWSMKYVTLQASDMDATHDPQDITFLASHDAVQWDELHKNNVHFSERGEIVEFIFNNENNYKYYSILVKGRNKLMNVGHYGLVQAYTKSCAAQLFYNITGYMVAPTSPHFYGKTLKTASDNACVFYDEYGDMYTDECDGRQVSMFEYNPSTYEIKATAGSKQGQCLFADGWFWPKLRSCDGSDEQIMEILHGKIKTSEKNKCLSYFDRATNNRLIFSDCTTSGNEIFHVSD